jgi:hypothetical protein
MDAKKKDNLTELAEAIRELAHEIAQDLPEGTVVTATGEIVTLGKNGEVIKVHYSPKRGTNSL